jgi:hypothetical protein
MAEIYEWNDIKAGFTDGLLLGNGASMAVHPEFNYGSLFEAAKDKGYLDDQVAKIFDAFKVNDFELVLRRLWQAKVVNEMLGVQVEHVDTAYQQVRSALIATVRHVHISHEDALKHLRPIYTFVHGFKTVVSLNYDLLVYWAIMESKDELGGWLKDCFGKGGQFADDWEQRRTPWNADGATLVFYPHGNLVLARDFDESERKIAVKGSYDLLGQILAEWEGERAVPLFVCDGTSEYKLKSIAGSSYLQRVYREVLPKMGQSLVVYGWAMNDQEVHILQKLRQARPERVAVSVHQKNEVYMQHVQKKLQEAGLPEPMFFDAASPGCWNNPEA